MDRRTLLRYVAPGIATMGGCVGGFDGSSSANEFVGVDVAGATTDLDETTVSATVTEQASQDGPARLSITFRNDGPERTFTFGASPPFSHYWIDTRSGPQLIAVPDTREYVRARNAETVDSLISDEATGGFWRATGTLIRLDIGIERTLRAGERLTEAYTLLGDYANQGELPRGEYELEGSEKRVALTVE